MHCQRFQRPALTRRDLLIQCASGFGAVAASALLADPAFTGDRVKSPLAPREPHFEPTAKNVIFLYMNGGPSQIDTFDPKPLLDKENGQPFKMKIEPTQFNNIGTTLASPWKFNNYGESGIPVSDLFPKVAGQIDDIAVIRSMTSEFSEHTNANYFLHTGSGLQGRPSMGAWVTYGLGSECQDLPGYVVLNGGLIPSGGLDNFKSGFLPASYEASIFAAGESPLANIRRLEANAKLQKNKLALMQQLDAGVLDRLGHVDSLESAIANYELAARMQVTVPELMDIRGETQATKQLYGLDAAFKNTQIYGRNCLIARRMVERGIRFVELTCTPGNGDRWDQHGGLKEGHKKNAKAVDQPIAGLLADLKQRGLLESTLVVWAGEFGRTPFAQGTDGRDHNPFGYTVWMAGGGVKGGTIYGATDEYGYKAVENRREMHDLHATMLHLLGVDHTKQTFRFGGRDMRLTDVKGHVIHDVIA